MHNSFLRWACSFDSDGTNDCVDDDRGSFAVQAGLDDMSFVETGSYGGGASLGSDDCWLFARGGSGGGGPLPLEVLALESIVFGCWLV